MASSFLDLELPVDVSTKKSAVSVKEKTVSVQGSTGTINIAYLEVFPLDGAPKRKSSVLLLHGMSFKSETWREIETLHTLSILGFHAVAIDLPGFGKSKGSLMQGPEAGVFLSRFIEATNLTNIVLASPSMSGGYSLPYIFSAESQGRLSGFVPVAPVNTGSITQHQYKQNQLPVMIVYGENDKNIGKTSLEHLSWFPNKHVVCLPGAGHACYMNKTEMWHQALYNFLEKVIEK